MRIRVTLLLTACLLLQSNSDAFSTDKYTVLLMFGVTDQTGQDWSGSVSAREGEVVDIRGHQFDDNDAVLSASKWEANSAWIANRNNKKYEGMRAPGVICTFTGGDNTRLQVKTAQGNFDVPVADIRMGVVHMALEGRATYESIPTTEQISETPGFDDWPAITVGPNSTVYTAWIGYRHDEGDRVYLRSKTGDQWSSPLQVNARAGDVFQVALGFQGSTLWILWSENLSGNWEIMGRPMTSGKLGRPRLISNAPGTDCDPVVAVDGDDLYLAWQSFRNGNGDIILARCREGNWSDAVAVTTHPANDWEPSISVSAGKLFVAWDTYRQGNYDVYLAEVNPEDFSSNIRPVTSTPAFEGHATMDADGQGGVWIAWENGGDNWGKDLPGTLGAESRGYKRMPVTVTPNDGRGLHSRDKFVGVAHYRDGQFTKPAQSIRSVLQGRMQQFHEYPRLSVDGAGRPWVVFRYGWYRMPGIRMWLWTAYAVRYDGSSWSSPILLPMEGRKNHRTAMVTDSEGRMHLAYVVDGRASSKGTYIGADAPRLISDRGVPEIRYASISQEQSPATTPVQEVAMEIEQPEGLDDDRTRYYYPTWYQGEKLRVYWGDLHRHTEISEDGGYDGSVKDLYRYAFDAAQMDFIATTDHNFGGDDLGEQQFSNWYTQWRTEKMADLYLVPGMLTPLFGYERSQAWPRGHRNVIRKERGYHDFTSFKMMGKPVPEDDEEQLWATLDAQGSDAITIPHTSATGMGMNWRISDPRYDRVVEIYQGDRNSYERIDGPKAPPNAEKYRDGFVSVALAKGMRFGFIASSDHWSTHISYAAVYAPEGSREALFSGLNNRRTYAATDKIGVDFRLNGRLMGEEFASAEAPVITAKLTGTDKIEWVDIIRDNEIIYHMTPNSREAGFTFVDRQATAGSHFYYIRLLQNDDAMAWASPIWVDYQPE
jgi:hypothetical protein